VAEREGLNLGTVGVQYDPRKGVLVNDHLQTQPRIYAAGDVCLSGNSLMPPISPPHVIRNLFLGRKKAVPSHALVHLTTEIAHVGLYEHDARSWYGSGHYAREFKEVESRCFGCEEEGS